MSKVKAEKMNSASVRYNNSVDTERVHDIVANANIGDGKVISMDAGVVRKGDAHVASFNLYGDHQVNYSLHGVEDINEQCAIIMAIHAFVTEVENEIEVNPINL